MQATEGLKPRSLLKGFYYCQLKETVTDKSGGDGNSQTQPSRGFNPEESRILTGRRGSSLSPESSNLPENSDLLKAVVDEYPQ